MGFDELSQTSLRNNGSLLRNTMGKYFRNAKGFAVNEKIELSARKQQLAYRKRSARTQTFYLWLVVCLMIMIAGLIYFL